MVRIRYNSQTETQDKEPPTNPAAASIEWSIILAELSSGMERLLYQKVADRKEGIFPDSLRTGISRLSAARIRAGATPIHTIAGAIELMQLPVSVWRVSPAPPDHMRHLILMDGEDITEDAENCIDSNPDVAGEWAQRIMKEVVKNCRTRGDQSGYVAFRRCVIERPVATRQELIQVNRKLSDDNLRAMFEESYEPVPPASLSSDRVRTCVRCGWTLLEEVNRDVWRCALDSCRQIEGVLPNQFTESLPFANGMRRVHIGLARYTTRPGGIEMRLFRGLANLGGLDVELWPHCDAYDIGITFPNGEKWAVDCKDARDPAWLAERLNRNRFSTLGSLTRAYYVFPGHRRRRPDYGRIFSSRWVPNPVDVKWSYDDDFLKEVRERLELIQ